MSVQVLYSYSIGFVYILVGQVLTGQLLPAVQFCAQVSPGDGPVSRCPAHTDH